MNESQTYRQSPRCWAVLVSCCLIAAIGFPLGTTLYSVFLTPMREAMGFSMTQVQLYNTACMCCTMISTFFGNRFMKMGAGKMVVVMSLAIMLGYNLMGFFPSVASIVIAGCLSGIAYPLLSLYTVPVIIGNWFYSRQGTWTSIGMACTGLGGLVLSPVATAIIGSLGWQRAFSVVSLLLFIPLLCGVFVIREHPLEQGILPHGATMQDLKRAEEEQAAHDALELPGLTFSQALRQPAFYVLAFTLLAIGVAASYAGNMNPIIQAAGYSAATAGIGLSAMSLGNVVSNPLLGMLRDRLGAVLSGLCGYGCLIVGFVLVVVSMGIGNPMFIIFAAFVTGLGGGSGLIMPTLYTKDALGSRDFERIYSVQMCMRAVGTSIATPLVGVLFDATGGYNAPIVMWVSAAAIAIVAGFIAVRLGHATWSASGRSGATDDAN